LTTGWHNSLLHETFSECTNGTLSRPFLAAVPWPRKLELKLFSCCCWEPVPLQILSKSLLRASELKGRCRHEKAVSREGRLNIKIVQLKGFYS
jgi:hypothetical protein